MSSLLLASSGVLGLASAFRGGARAASASIGQFLHGSSVQCTTQPFGDVAQQQQQTEVFWHAIPTPFCLFRFSSSAAAPATHSDTQLDLPSPSHLGADIPPALLKEFNTLESKLDKSSRVRGSERLTFSRTQLPFEIPEHEVEGGLHTINVHARAVQGRNACKWLKKMLRVPGRIMSFPGGSKLLIHMEDGHARRLVQLYGRNGCQAQAIALKVVHPDDPNHVLSTIRVKPQMVHMTSTKQVVENIDFLFCPKERIVEVNVPVRLINEELAPGTKKGGWMQILQRTVKYQAFGSTIPPFVELDVRSLDVNKAITLGDLPILPGTRIPTQPIGTKVVVCTTSTGEK